MQIEYVKNPQWANSEQTLIDLVIKWDERAEELPFTASPTDSDEYGRVLFSAAVAGEFGPVAEYVAPPEPAPEPPQPKRFTSLEFLDLFTESEQLAVATAAMQSAQVKLWYDRTLAASFVTLADPRTEAGLTALVGAGLLTAERRDAILKAMQ